MTLSPDGLPPAPSQELVKPSHGAHGLDDMNRSDLVTPRVSVVHDQGVFVDNMTNTRFPILNCVILGLVKQRTLFHENVENKDKPMCRSNNFEIGFPTTSGNPPAKLFPWQKAELDASNAFQTQDGRWAVKCEECKLQQWGTSPDGKSPYCSVVWTLPIMMDPFSNGNLVPAILSFKRSQIGATKLYLSNFQRADQAAFTIWTEIKLNVNRRGSVDYSTPVYRALGPTESDRWEEFAGLYDEMRTFLIQDPMPFRDDEQSRVQSNVAQPSMQQPQQQQQAWQPPQQQQPQWGQNANPWAQGAPQQGQPDPWAQPQQAQQNDPWATPPAWVPPAQPQQTPEAAPPFAPSQVQQQPTAPPFAPQQPAPAAPQQSVPVVPPGEGTAAQPSQPEQASSAPIPAAPVTVPPSPTQVVQSPPQPSGPPPQGQGAPPAAPPAPPTPPSAPPAQPVAQAASPVVPQPAPQVPAQDDGEELPF